MQTHPYTPSLGLWWLRIATFSVAALAAASVAFWVLKWTATAAPTSAPVVFQETRPADPLAVARVLGGGQAGVAAGPAPVSAASRFKLTGVVANSANGGYALISVDGKPAKPYRVGAQVDDALVLHSVTARSAALAPRVDAPANITLDLPKLSQH